MSNAAMQQVTQSSNKMASSPLVIADFQSHLQKQESYDCTREGVHHIYPQEPSKEAARHIKSIWFELGLL